MMRQETHGSIALVALFACALSACSDDTFVATNEQEHDSGSGKGGATSGGGASSGGAAGLAGSGGETGTAGSGGTSGGGTAGAGGSMQCTPGQTQDVGTCDKCGTSKRTCDASGQWGAPVCENQKDCNPGATTGGCGDVCEEKVCTSSCTWGACAKKASAKCIYEAGTNWQCCGNDMWQFCNKDTCDWHPCAACGSSCASQCN